MFGLLLFGDLHQEGGDRVEEGGSGVGERGEAGESLGPRMDPLRV